MPYHGRLMDVRTRSTRPTALRELLSSRRSLAGVLTWSCLVASAGAEEFRVDFDSSKTSWEAEFEAHQVGILRHDRDGYVFHSGTAAEAIRFESTGETDVRLTHPIEPASLVIDDFTASLWLRANRAGATLAVRVTLPHQPDASTGKAVSFDVRGDAYTAVDNWQQLSCQTLQDSVERQLQLVRGRLGRTLGGQRLNLSGMHVSEVLLIVPGNRGVTDLRIDDLVCGPIVRLDDVGGHVRPAANLSLTERPESPIRMETNRMLVQGKPFFARIFPYHGENLDALRDLGANVAWIDRYDNQILIEQLAARGIWSMAAPPRAPQSGTSSTADVGLMPIPETTSSVLFWNVGTRVPASQMRAVETWIDQIRDADRAYSSPRPVVADVIGEERRFSRHLSLLGSSRHTLHTTVSPLDYKFYLEHKRRLGLPDRIKWTLIQTEPAVGNVVTRSPSRDKPVFVEAEQIWLQAWTAISAGYKAIGFWRSPDSTPLDVDTPENNELRLALTLLNVQIDLLEPWIATGKVADSVPVTVKLKQSPDLGQTGYHFRNPKTSRSEQQALLTEHAREHDRAQRVTSEVHAAVINSTYGKLVIPVWYEEGAQFQPGQMAAQDVSFLVQAGEFARAWQVTTTAVRSLTAERSAGGWRVEMPMIDQHAFVVITTDPKLEDKLMQRIRTVRKRSGALWVELAKAKRDRIKATHAEIERTGAPQVPDAHQLLSQAAMMVTHAEQQLQDEQFFEAERYSRLALQLLRQLQRTHWENAVADLTSPTTSPHTICFETLPDHWRMLETIGASPDGSGENLLRSGDFEDLDSMEVDGWHQNRSTDGDPEWKIAELHADAAQGNYSLRMRSISDPRNAPTRMTEPVGPDVVVISPGVPVRGGQIVLISGQIRVDRISSDSVDGMMIYDNIKGTVGALRWKRPSPGGRWESFQIIREVPSTQDVQLKFELYGAGDVHIDDLQLVALTTTIPGEPRPFGTRERGPGRNLLDFAPALPKVRLWPGRKTADEVPEAARPTP